MGKGKVIHMKKRLFLILSVTVMLAAGCGSTDNAVPDMEPEAAETVVDVVEPDMTENKEVTAAYQAQNGDTGKEQTAEEMAKEPGQEKEDKGAADTPEPKTEEEQGIAVRIKPEAVLDNIDQTIQLFPHIRVPGAQIDLFYPEEAA